MIYICACLCSEEIFLKFQLQIYLISMNFIIYLKSTRTKEHI